MSTLKVSNISNIDGTKNATTNDISDVANNIAYAQVNKIAGQTMASGFDSILLDEVTVSKNITLASNSLTFAIAGVYQISVGWRFGSASDSWTGVNLWNATTGIVGQSFGTGNVNNDPGPAMFTFLANVQNISVSYRLRTFRGGATMAVITPNTDAGRAFVATIVKVS